LSEIDLSVGLAGRRLANPTLLASGVAGESVESLLSAIAAGAGGAVSKSIGSKPRRGYSDPTVVRLDSGTINAVGLSNPGAARFSKRLDSLKGSDAPIIVSVFGRSPTEFSKVVRTLDGKNFAGYELNLSCPHVEGVGTEVGHDPELVARVVKAIKSTTEKPVFAKLSPNTERILEVARAAVDEGVDGITAINTVRVMMIDVETQRPVLSHRTGGLSGSAIRPIALRCVYELSEEFEVPIMGVGGISRWDHAVQFLLAGASAVQVGTAASGDYGLFTEIVEGIRGYMRRKDFRKVGEMTGLAHRG
jgi:dihydroorotate dehydrogenase (NAD+) catalytic subunit